MKVKDFFAAIEKIFPEADSDSKKAKLLDLTQGRISQWKAGTGILTSRQMAMQLKRTAEVSRKRALTSAIRPIVELHRVERTSSKQDATWEILPTGFDKNPRQRQLRRLLESSRGIYFFYNSQGEVLYTGKTEKQSLWKELNLTFNRERESHKAFMVDHPTTGSVFEAAWKKPRQPVKRVIYLHDVASFFSAYEVAPELIAPLEALVVRAICNDLSNIKMEKFRFPI